MERKFRLVRTHGQEQWISYKIFKGMVETLHKRGIYYVWDACIGGLYCVGYTKWKSTAMLELEENKKEEWMLYICALCPQFHTLDEDKVDSLIWARNEKSCIYITKLGYKMIAERV
jgi:hypothetical protein